MDKKISASRKQEARIAKAFGGEVTPRSGAGPVKKGDIRTPTELIEAKTTAAGSYSLKLWDLNVAYHNALLTRKRMVFAIEFANDSQSGLMDYDYVVLREDDYLELTQKAGERAW